MVEPDIFYFLRSVSDFLRSAFTAARAFPYWKGRTGQTSKEEELKPQRPHMDDVRDIATKVRFDLRLPFISLTVKVTKNSR